MGLTNITQDSFKTEVLDADKLVIVDFWATWCVPCKMVEPVLEKLSGKTALFIFSDGTYTKFEGMKKPEDYTRELAQKYNVCFYMISSATTWRAGKQLEDMAKANACSRVVPIEAFVNNSEYLTGPLFVVKSSAVVETTTETRIVGLKAQNVQFDL